MDAFFGVIGFVGVIVSIVFLSKNKGDKAKQKPFQVILGLSIIFFIIGLALPSSETETSKENQVKEVEESKKVEEEIEKELTYEEKIETVIVDIIGNQTNMKKDTIMEVSATEERIDLELMGNESLSGSATARVLRTKSLDLTEAIFNKFSLEELTISWNLELIDAYGNENISRVMLITVKAETAEKINYKNVLNENIPKIVDSYWLHPALQ